MEINRKRGNMAVVVKQMKGNRYKAHRILTPEGAAFLLPNMANAEMNTVGAFTNGSQSLEGSTPAITSASNNSLLHSSPDVNAKLLTKEQQFDAQTDTSSRASLRTDAELEAAVRGIQRKRESGEISAEEARHPFSAAVYGRERWFFPFQCKPRLHFPEIMP